MTDITTEVTGFEQVQTALTRTASAGADVQRTVLHALGEEYVAVLKDFTPLGKGENPGTLRGGYQTQESYSDTSGEFRITNTTPHLTYVLNGRSGVTARSAKALRFVIGGQVIFRKSVGPAAANNFPPKARAQMQPKIDQAASQIAGLVIKVYEGS